MTDVCSCHVGKSTLASILLGKEIPQHWKSTDGLIIYFGRNGIDLKDKTIVNGRIDNAMAPQKDKQ
jgi:Fe-S cluster assembly ATPase SufC